MISEEKIKERIAMLEAAHKENDECAIECAIEGGYADEDYQCEREVGELEGLKWVVEYANY